MEWHYYSDLLARRSGTFSPSQWHFYSVVCKERNELLNTFDEILEVTELLESRLDHLYYFHALEIPNDMDVKLLTLKKELLEINAFCRNYRNFINIYYN